MLVTPRAPHHRLTPLSDTSELTEEGSGTKLDARGTRCWRRTLRGYLLLPHLAPVLVVESATAAFAVIAWGGLPPADKLGTLLLAMLGGQLAIGATNELVDLPYDTVGKPWKPLASGDVSIRGAQTMLAVGLIMLGAFGSRFGALPFALLAAGTGLGIAYDLWFKRTVWSWLPYLLALPLLPIWVFTALGKAGAEIAAALPARGAGDGWCPFRPGAPRRGDRSRGRPADRDGSPRSAAHLRRRLVGDALCGAIGLARGLAVGRRPALRCHRARRRADRLLLVSNLILMAINRPLGVAACFPLVALSTLASALAWVLVISS